MAIKTLHICQDSVGELTQNFGKGQASRSDQLCINVIWTSSLDHASPLRSFTENKYT